MSHETNSAGRYLRATREAHQMTQEQLSDRAEMSQSEVSRLERGDDLPSFEQVAKLSEALPGRSESVGCTEPLNAVKLMKLAVSDARQRPGRSRRRKLVDTDAKPAA